MSTIHNPVNFEPHDYEVLDYLDNHRPEYYFGMSSEAYADMVRQWEQDMVRALGMDWHAKAHRCVHCGNGSVRWITVCLHRPTNERVVFGADCTARLGFANKMAFKLAQLQARASAHAARVKVAREVEAFFAKHPEVKAAHEQFVVNVDGVHTRNSFAADIFHKLTRYGSLSEKQAAAVVTSIARDIERAQQQATQATEPKGDAPEGRIEVTGEVLSVQDRETDFGIVTKMLVKLTNNSKVWLTVPRSCEVKRNNIITVRATFSRSRDDKSFAFGSRPLVIRVGVQ